jgi:hypothetical protein
VEQVTVKPRIKCFVSAQTPFSDKDKKQKGLIGFAIPDLGILFKSAQVGSHHELEYVSLLSLLRFVELNCKAFENVKIVILCSSPLLVYQMSESAVCQEELRRHRNLALAYKKRLNFSVSWVPENENRAQNGMIDLPALKNSFDFNFEDIQKDTW